MKLSLLKGIEKSILVSRQAKIIRDAFAVDYYLSQNPDVRLKGLDPIKHYIRHGWIEGRNPHPDFNTTSYLLHNKDVLLAGMNPFFHYVRYGKAEGRLPNPSKEFESMNHNTDYIISRAAHLLQNQTFPVDAEKAENLLIIIVPEHNEMSGGIYSFFSIAKAAYNLRHKHDYFIMIMTRPNKMDVTYTRQRNFRNSEDVFRFEQIVRCSAAKTLHILIPEYATTDFVSNLNEDQLNYLRSRDKLFINILNQKTDIMPEKEEFEDLRAIATELTQSVAHHAYFGQYFSDHYNLPTLLLPAYTDLSNYDPIAYEDKEKLIIYSPDDSPYRKSVLTALAEGLPDYTLREIRGITFDKFMDLATRCRFSVTFGEGFDGYLAQPIYQGGVGFSVYNDEFFPSESLRDFANIFKSGDDMISGIVQKIRHLENNKDDYQQANKAMMDVYDSLYSKADYMRRIEMLINREFELYPLHLSGVTKPVRI
ncbi:hypothetical protein H4S14_000197 [Agrobacterium vitis]|nr:hypothetical protein [Agrobacterium vitis]MBE1436470.1 hypothetical protein [Agrobacterium vitis]